MARMRLGVLTAGVLVQRRVHGRVSISLEEYNRSGKVVMAKPGQALDGAGTVGGSGHVSIGGGGRIHRPDEAMLSGQEDVGGLLVVGNRAPRQAGLSAEKSTRALYCVHQLTPKHRSAGHK